MSFSGGVYTLPGPALVTGEVVSATENNSFRNDVAGAFNVTMLRNGTSTATANLPMGGYKLTGLGVATTSGDALSYGNAAVVTTLTSTSLTATRVPYAGTGGLLQDASTFTFDGTTLTAGGFTTSGAISAGTITASGAITVSGGTANGVAYLNGSKVLTTGSALTFDGTNLGVGQTTPAAKLDLGTTVGKDVLLVYGGGSGSQYGLGISGGLLELYTSSTGGISFNQRSGASYTEQMRLTSTGLGIGTSSPSYKLDVRANYANIQPSNGTDAVGWRTQNTGGQMYFGIDSSVGNNFDTGTAYAGVIWRQGAYPICFVNNSTEKMRLDSSGNLGLGVTPSAWYSGIKALEINGKGNSIYGIGTEVDVTANAYYPGGAAFLYGQNGYATKYVQITGQHQWYTAPSGTAGNAITFTQAMTLDASGNLGLGVTPVTDGSYRTFTLNGTSGSELIFEANGTINSSLWVNASQTNFYTTTATPIVLGTNNTERMRIDSSGNLLVGTTQSTWASYPSRFVVNANSDTTWLGVFNTTGGGTGTSIGFLRSGTQVGSIAIGSSSTAYNTSSDYRLKENIQPMQNALAVVQQLNPVTYTWKADGSDGQGFIAHELQAVVPDCVTGEKDAVDAEGKPVYQGIDTSFLVATLTKAIQELEARVKQLEGK